MKFFLPFAVGAIQSERVYSRIVDRLKAIGYEVTADRVHEIVFRRGGALLKETVGETSENGETVLAIFKDHIGYFICTYSHGAVWGDPMVARYSTVESSDFFDCATEIVRA